MSTPQLDARWQQAFRTRPPAEPFSWAAAAARLANPNPDFTNPDLRLRPTTPIHSQNNHPHSYQITAQSFPEFYATYRRMASQAGSPIRSIFVTPEVSPYAAKFIRDTNQIWINLSLFNSWNMEEITTMLLGHEMGHDWRKAHPNAPRLPAPAKFREGKYHEYESDMIGVCLNNNTRGMLDWMRTQSHGRPNDYPTNEELRAGLERMHWSDCPFPSNSFVPEIPLLLRAPSRQK